MDKQDPGFRLRVMSVPAEYALTPGAILTPVVNEASGFTTCPNCGDDIESQWAHDGESDLGDWGRCDTCGVDYALVQVGNTELTQNGVPVDHRTFLAHINIPVPVNYDQRMAEALARRIGDALTVAAEGGYFPFPGWAVLDPEVID